MDEREYERRKQDLESQLEAGIELLRAGARAQRTALDLVWTASPSNPRAGVLPFEIPLAQRPAPPPPPPPPPPERRKRWGAGQLRAAVEAALQKVPEEFDRTDLLAALGANPDRGSLYRILDDLRLEGAIERLQSGSGQSPSRYRKLR